MMSPVFAFTNILGIVLALTQCLVLCKVTEEDNSLASNFIKGPDKKGFPYPRKTSTTERCYSGIPGIPGVPGNHGLMGVKGDRGSPGRCSGQCTGQTIAVKPNYAFTVTRSEKQGPMVRDSRVQFDRVLTNVGGAFKVGSASFHAPLNATYVFNCHVLSQNHRDVYSWLMKNHEHLVPLHGDGRAGYGSASQSLVLTLSKGDRIWLQLRKGSALLNDFTSFSGYLLF